MPQQRSIPASSCVLPSHLLEKSCCALWLGSMETPALQGDGFLPLHTEGGCRSTADPGARGRRAALPSRSSNRLIWSHSTSGKTPPGALGWQIAAQAAGGLSKKAI